MTDNLKLCDINLIFLLVLYEKGPVYTGASCYFQIIENTIYTPAMPESIWRLLFGYINCLFIF